MVLRNILTKAAPLARNIQTSSVVRGGHHDTRGEFGSNLPFPVRNRAVTTVLFMLFFGSGLAVPFLALRHMILQKNQ